MGSRLSLWLILTAYLLVGGLYALFTPSWESPDEPAHYNYVRQLAGGHLPVIEVGDYDQAYLTEVVFHSHFAAEYSTEPIEYEDWQPPLFYLLQLPIYLISGGSLGALRLFSLLLGAGVVALAFEITSRVLPGRPWAATNSAAFVAFLPQHISILASVNNDSLAELLIAATLLTLLSWSQADEGGKKHGSDSKLRVLGLLLGLGFLTKGTAYPASLVVGIVLMKRSWGNWSTLIRRGLNVGIPSFLLGSIWWVRNLIVYGGFDILGKAAHDAVVTGQPLTSDLVADAGKWEAAWKFIQTTFNSFWGQFGWMTVPLPSVVYLGLWLFTGLVFAGLFISWFRQVDRAERHPTDAFIMMATLLALTFGLHVAYNLTFEQHQGRYLFPALIPISIGVAMGLDGWFSRVQAYFSNAAYWMSALFAFLLIGFDIWALFGVLVPSLA